MYKKKSTSFFIHAGGRIGRMQRFNKIIIHLLVASLIYTPSTLATPYTSLPEIGTAAVATLSVEKEIEYGAAYMRMLRASQPIVHDPLLSEYISALGAKLLAKANDVKTPFTFFLVQNRDINAFAFFGGHIGLHTGLFLFAENQSELASVISHEIAHLTQRHLARAMEQQSKQTPLAMAAIIASIMLTIAAPQAGMAALQATTAASIQSRINYTRSNEQEADRLGIETLSRAGFDVNGMPRFFSRMADQYRYTTKPPQFLLTHPLPDSRITDSRGRAQQYPQKADIFSPSYALARARIVARYADFSRPAALNWFDRRLKDATPKEKASLSYGKALVYIDNMAFKKAKKILDVLIKAEPNNRYYLDALTDFDTNQKQFDRAIKRLEKALETQPNNAVLQLNRDSTLIKAGKYTQAINNLHRFTHRHSNDMNGWALLQEAYDKSGKPHGALAAQGELYALQGRWKKAISNYIQSSHLVPLGSLDQARYDARIDQLRVEEIRFADLQR